MDGQAETVSNNVSENGLKSGQDKKLKRRRRPPPPPGIKDDITSLAHASLFVYISIIAYLCFAKPFSFFDWHPLLLSIGWGLFAIEAVLVISKQNPFSRGVTRTWKIRWHWGLFSAATILIILGQRAAFITKENNQKQHFKSWHAIFGLLANIAFIPAVLNGIPALYDVELKKLIKPNTNKTIHEISGSVGLLFAGISLILSVFTKWFANHSDNNKYIFLTALVSITFSFLWAFQRPFTKSMRKLFKVELPL